MKYLLTGEETERLKFRMLNHNDFNTWLEFFNDPTVAGFLGLNQLPTPLERCEKWFSLSENRYKDNRGGLNVLIDKSTGEFIGQCGLLLQEVDNTTELEIGYSILPQFWNKGYATEAARKCRDFAFLNKFTDSLISIVHVENVKSQKVALHNGMSIDKQTIFHEMPVYIFRINIEEWRRLTR